MLVFLKKMKKNAVPWGLILGLINLSISKNNEAKGVIISKRSN